MSSLSLDHSTFSALTGHDRPFAWQERLYSRFIEGTVPAALDLPTGLGKTSVIALWLTALARQMAEGAPRLPRRLVYVVDRRAVVDQATREAEKLCAALAHKAELGAMRRALGLGDGEALAISTLRGQHADNRQWLADPSRPAIIVGTVDMIGSRLLFSGYGVSPNMRPMHAGLLAVDTLVLLDEAHLVPAFQRLLEAVAGLRDASPWHTGTLWPERNLIRPLQVLPLSATQIDGAAQGPQETGDRAQVFTLSDDDVTRDAPVQERLNAPKALTLRAIASGGKEDDRLAEAMAAAARELVAGDNGMPNRRRLIVYCDKRTVAQNVLGRLDKKDALKGVADLELFVGARRVHERERAARRLEELGFLAGGGDGGGEARDRPAILIATSAAEVGVDLDADDLICDLVPLERMIQRFGRVNRRGRRSDTRVLVFHPEPLPEKAAHAAQLPHVLAALGKLDGDASPLALRRLAGQHGALVRKASTPPPLYPPLTRATVEAWALTNLPRHTGRPRIDPWLRGWIEDAEPQAEILWRTHLPWPENGTPQERAVNAFFASARPHLLEVLETSANAIAELLLARAEALGKTMGGDASASEDGEEGRLCEAWRQGVILLDRGNEYAGHIPMEELLGMKKRDLAERIAYHRIVAPAALGGLAESGLLDRKSGAPALALDTIADRDVQTWLGFRVREEESGDGAWRTDARFLRNPEAESDDSPHELVVEVFRGEREAPLLGEPAITRRTQRLLEHIDWVRDEVERLADRLALPGDLREVLRLAALAHDVGKARQTWQRAMRGDVRDPWAKTTSCNAHMLAGFRHEFASVLDMAAGSMLSQIAYPEALRAHVAEVRKALAELPQEHQDLALHLIAAHHGRARP